MGYEFGFDPLHRNVGDIDGFIIGNGSGSKSLHVPIMTEGCDTVFSSDANSDVCVYERLRGDRVSTAEAYVRQQLIVLAPARLGSAIARAADSIRFRRHGD
jgi:hypothetical protein